MHLLHDLRPRVPELVHHHRLAHRADRRSAGRRAGADPERARPLRHRLVAVHVLRHLRRRVPVRRPGVGCRSHRGRPSSLRSRSSWRRPRPPPRHLSGDPRTCRCQGDRTSGERGRTPAGARGRRRRTGAASLPGLRTGLGTDSSRRGHPAGPGGRPAAARTPPRTGPSGSTRPTSLCAQARGKSMYSTRRTVGRYSVQIWHWVPSTGGGARRDAGERIEAVRLSRWSPGRRSCTARPRPSPG